MKKFLATFLTIAMMAIMLPIAVDAQTRNSNRYNSRTKQQSTYQKHRNLINIGVGTGVGALVGAIAGGKKGAAVGAVVGGGSAAVYSYGINPKKKNTRRTNRRY
jgi:outer membrane lipoprotein SlyB